jgi:hypothetical protein
MYMVNLNFPYASTSLLQKEREKSRLIYEISPIPYFIFFCCLVFQSSVMYVYRNIEARSCNSCCSGKAITNILNVYL